MSDNLKIVCGSCARIGSVLDFVESIGYLEDVRISYADFVLKCKGCGKEEWYRQNEGDDAKPRQIQVEY